MILPDEQAMLRLFEAGTSHLHDVLPSEYDRLKRREAQGDYRVVELGPSFNTNYLMFNLDPRQDVKGAPKVDPVRLSWFSKKAFVLPSVTPSTATLLCATYSRVEVRHSGRM